MEAPHNNFSVCTILNWCCFLSYNFMGPVFPFSTNVDLKFCVYVITILFYPLGYLILPWSSAWDSHWDSLLVCILKYASSIITYSLVALSTIFSGLSIVIILDCDFWSMYYFVFFVQCIVKLGIDPPPGCLQALL